MSTDQQRPHEGGSYVVGKDGKLDRREFTIQPGEPGHAPEPTPPAEPAAKKGKK